MIRFTSPYHDEGVYLRVGDIRCVLYGGDGVSPALQGTWIYTYQNAQFHVMESPAEVAEKVREAARRERLGLEQEGE